MMMIIIINKNLEIKSQGPVQGNRGGGGSDRN
jgi:hypothetical protein